MEIIVLKEASEVTDRAAALVQELVNKKPKAVLGLATGSTPIELYQRLIQLYREEEISFQDVITFNLDEYLGIDPQSKQSYRSFMRRKLFDDVDIDLANTHLPECTANQNPRKVGKEYEEKIALAGGIDLQLLGIGANGHIGFNEPTSSLSSRTRVKTLTEQTVLDNSRLFDSGEQQPLLAMTMGIATILDASHILLIATGRNKAKAIRNAVEGPVTAMCPASVLQLHSHVVVVIDEAAANELEGVEYYQWADSQHSQMVDKYGVFSP